MAAFDTSRPAYGIATSAGFSVIAFARAVVGQVTDWNDARKTRKALSALSDRELEDIGLIRGDIDRVAQSDFIR